VLSNIGFALVGLWGFARLRPMRRQHCLRAGWHGSRLFLLGLVLTATGSAFARLVWGRLPIALACAGLLAAVRTEVRPGSDTSRDAAVLALPAVLSVSWWYPTALRGQGDLRPYLLLQALPLVLIPLWQAIHASPRHDRLWFGIAPAALRRGESGRAARSPDRRASGLDQRAFGEAPAGFGCRGGTGGASFSAIGRDWRCCHASCKCRADSSLTHDSICIAAIRAGYLYDWTLLDWREK
jgi:hypothetical protein